VLKLEELEETVHSPLFAGEYGGTGSKYQLLGRLPLPKSVSNNTCPIIIELKKE
jgi:hypothetical protein